jgi:hypothetical protein
MMKGWVNWDLLTAMVWLCQSRTWLKASSFIPVFSWIQDFIFCVLLRMSLGVDLYLDINVFPSISRWAPMPGAMMGTSVSKTEELYSVLANSSATMLRSRAIGES